MQHLPNQIYQQFTSNLEKKETIRQIQFNEIRSQLIERKIIENVDPEKWREKNSVRKIKIV